MRGKRIDSEFVASFIEECIGNKIKHDQIPQEALHQIHAIDLQIMEIEKLKRKRSGLLDVIESIGKASQNKMSEKEKLGFYQISNQSMAYMICSKIKNNKHYCFSPWENDLINQMIRNNVIYTNQNIAIEGEKMNNFCNFYELDVECK